MPDVGVLPNVSCEPSDRFYAHAPMKDYVAPVSW